MNANQKGSALEGTAVTEEVLDSTDSIHTKTLFGGQKGLQQFYTPPVASELIAEVIGGGVYVLDPTAGDGSLLRGFHPTRRFGVEIDHGQVQNARDQNNVYHAVKGDIQHVYPLLKNAPSWKAIVANPPFGLQWIEQTINGGKSTNSTLLTFLMLSRLLADDGQYAFICGRDRFRRQILPASTYAPPYAILDVNDLFEGTTLPSVIVFGASAGAWRSSVTPEEIQGKYRRAMPANQLDMAAQWVKDARHAATDGVALREYDYAQQHENDWKAVQSEYDRRLEKRFKKDREFDLLLVGGNSVQWMPSAYAQMALRARDQDPKFYGLNGSPISYFSTNDALWNKLLRFHDDGIISIEPRLIDAVELELSSIRKERVPMYPLKPQQRLGFLSDLEFITCKLDDPKYGFMAGEQYTIDASARDTTEDEVLWVPDPKEPGELKEKRVRRQRQHLRISIGGRHQFYDSGANASENINWLLAHFELPDPGDVSTRYPEEIEAARKIVREVFEEFEAQSEIYEKTHDVPMKFRARDFQIEHIARLLFKGGGLLSWEQGLGKTLGGLAFYKAMVKSGKQDCLLVVTANDLVPQWTRECQRFLGVKPTMIKDHAQAHSIAKKLKRGGTGIYITDYTKMSISGTRGKNALLPEVTVREWTEPRKVKGTETWGRFEWVWPTADETPVTGDELEAEKAAAKARYKAKLLEDKYNADRYGDYDDDQWEGILERGWFRHTELIQMPIDDYTKGHYGYIHLRTKEITKKLTSRHLCPSCEADRKSGWTGVYCEAELADGSNCGYSHHAVKVKPIASRLSVAFSRGVGIYDEIQMVQAKAGMPGSKRLKALQGVRFGAFLGMSGTPIKEYIDQAFWPLWKSLGNANAKFPYGYERGDIKFATDFSVIEWTISGGRKSSMKFLPEVSNLSLLWRLLSSSIIRCRKEETGEPLVPKYYHEIKVPLGLQQATQIQAWLAKFPDLFEEKYPDSKMVKSGFHRLMPATLGLNWKLDYACTLPEADPDYEWTGVDVSNYTPANLKVLQLAMKLVQDGRKVLIGSNLKSYGPWIAEQLRQRGVNAVEIVDAAGETLNPGERAETVYDFQSNPDTQVFCAGTAAIRLGHNLDAASAVILNGLDFSYEIYDQFLARIHRLTSKNPVDVYVILPTLDEQETIATRKWDLLTRKGDSAELALDGRLIVKSENEISESALINELIEAGLEITDEAIPEEGIKRIWESLPQYTEFVAELPERPTDDEVRTEQGVVAAEAVGDFLKAFYTGQLALVAEPGTNLDDTDDTELLVDAEYVADDELDALEAQFLLESSDKTEPPVLGDASHETTREVSLDLAGEAPGGSETPDGEEMVEIVAPSDNLSDEPPSADPEDELVKALEATAEPPPLWTPGEPFDRVPEPQRTPAETIKDAKELLELEILTQSEYDAIKQAQLALMGVAA